MQGYTVFRMLCEKHGIGSADPTNITVTGEKIEDQRTQFQTAKHNIVSKLELVFRASIVRKIIFDTPVFKAMTWGTRRYYDFWDIAYGRRLRKKVLDSSPYAPQWTDEL